VSDEKQHDQQHDDNDALEGSALGGRIRIPAAWAGSIGPYLKWPVIAISAGLFVVLVCYGIRLVIQ
jgi:hypothetical protein